MLSPNEAREMTNAFIKMKLAKQFNRIEAEVLRNIEEGRDACFVKNVPEWVVNNLPPKWKATPLNGGAEIRW